MKSYQIGQYDIRDIQKKMLNILIEIDRICKKHHIRYILDSGTMLGAVRHKGFIPWDDDADIIIPRDDYDRFITIAEKEMRAPYVFQCIENTKEYPYNFGKVFDTSTTYTERFTAKLDISHGIYVDVFPMDYVDEKDYLKHARMIGHYTMLRFYKLGISVGSKAFIGKLLPLSFINARATAHMKYHGTPGDMICKLCHYGKNKPPINISLFNDTIEVPFEGVPLRVPADYDSFLKGRYGDYMRLPDEDQQKPSHHVTEVIL